MKHGIIRILCLIILQGVMIFIQHILETDSFEEFASEWSEKNKIKPTEVSIGSHKKVIWRCEKGHEWEAAVKSRTINKTDADVLICGGS